EQQARRLQRNAVESKQVLSARAAGRLPGQNRVSGKERGEHDDVAEQEDPEAEGRDDALGSDAALRVLDTRQVRIRPAADTNSVGGAASRRLLCDTHSAAPS